MANFDEKSDEEAVIFKITSPHIGLLDKYFSLLNVSLESHVGIVFLERVQDGMLYISKNLKNFIEFHSRNQKLPPISKQLLSKKILAETQAINPNEMIDFSRFPNNSIELKIIPQNVVSIKAIESFYQYFLNLSKDIHVELAQDHVLTVRYKDVQTLQAQIGLIFTNTLPEN